ncbi:MAG TPA: tetratricopeptide repeat protein, partial [bacterium]|nr:tetratricopeptide repeat protein [bacterium]
MGAYLLSGWLHEKRLDKPLLKYSLLSCAATFLNPYFWRGVAFPLRIFTLLQGSNVFKQYISELQPPWAITQDPSAPFLPELPLNTYRVFSLVVLVVIWLSFQRRKIHELLLTGIFFGLSLVAVRNVPLFFWVTLPIAAAALFDLLTFYPFTKRLDSFLRSNKTLPILISILVLLTCARVLTRAYYISDRRMIHNGLGMDPWRFPIQAADYMAQNHLDGRLLNDMSYGGWLDWKGPAPVFIDGRLEAMGEGLFTRYRDSFYPGRLPSLLSDDGIQMVLADHMMDTAWTSQLGASREWRLLYFDAFSALYARTGYRAELPPTAWGQALAQWGLQTAPPDSILTDLADKPISPFSDWICAFVVPQDYPMPLFRLGAFAYENGQFDVARAFFLEMLRQTHGCYFEVYYNLGATYERLGHNDLAQICYERALALNPAYTPARQKLGRL